MAVSWTQPEYDHEEGIRIRPGHWRPHNQWEHVAWVSPPWPSPDYVWLDVPEAVFADRGPVYVSHLNPDSGQLYESLPGVPFHETEGGIAYERLLPNGVGIRGSVTRRGETSVRLRLDVVNGSPEALTGVRVPACVCMRGITEFHDHTNENTFVRHPEAGWTTLAEAADRGENGDGVYRVGAEDGPLAADLPVAVKRSSDADRLVAVTWFDDTHSLWGNDGHPCIHADPVAAPVDPGETRTLRGELVFFEGGLDAFDERIEAVLAEGP